MTRKKPAVAPATDFLVLADLPAEHPLRCSPLSAIGAQYRSKGAKATSPWRTVHAGYAIAGATFNQLGPGWTLYSHWRAPAP